MLQSQETLQIDGLLYISFLLPTPKIACNEVLPEIIKKKIAHFM